MVDQIEGDRESSAAEMVTERAEYSIERLA
jgi:hypothetical protein